MQNMKAFSINVRHLKGRIVAIQGIKLVNILELNQVMFLLMKPFFLPANPRFCSRLKFGNFA